MSTLTGELERLRAVVDSLPTRRILPTNQMRPTRRVLERLLKALDVVPALPEARLEQARRSIVAAQRNGTDLSTLSNGILNDAVWLLWPDAADGVNRATLRRAILARIGTRSSMLRRLIDVWLLQFTRGDDSFVEVGRHIDRHLATEHRGILGLWKESHRAYGLFDATAGPDRLASRVLEESDAKTLVACRLDNPSRAKSGYLRAVHFALSAKLPKLLVGDNAPKVLQRAIQFYAPDRTLRFDEKQPNGAMADALVSPWVKPLPSLSDTIRSNVLTHLRQYLGDPRVDARQRWGGASEETRQIVRGWLSKLSLDAFFDIVGQFAGMAGMGHQWKARKAFWNLCLQRGHITDSWLVLGYNVRRSVSDKRELQGSFGNLIDGDPNRSVLLMQIGNLVFSEWTYSGKLRAWNVNARQAPKLFRQEYLREEVTADCLSFPPPRGREGDLEETGTDGVTHTKVWQGRVAALLRQREGIVLQPSDWYVR